MKPGFKFSSVAAALLSFSLRGVSSEISLCNVNTNGGAVTRIIGVFGVLSVMGANAFPPILQKRLGSPTPEIGGGKFSVSFEDEDSDEEEDDILDSSPRQEPHITPLNRDQCLAKLLCGMSVPVTGGGSKKNYYSEYAQIVSKFFEAFPLDDEYQSKESMELYDDYSNEDDKPSRMNSKRKPLNSSRVEATAPTLQLFDLALVDVGPKADELGKNRTRKEYDAINKVFTGNRIARARRIVENIGQKLQTVRQCQSIGGCPFTFKQLREKLKKKEAQRVSSNVPLPSPLWPGNPNRKNSTPSPFQIKPKPKPQNRPIPPTPKPEPLSVEGLFSNEEPIFPYKDTNKGDDEMEEIFGPPKVNKRPSLGFHQGVDDNYHYEYNPDKPWRPGGNNGGNSYGYRPWKTRPRPRPQQSQQQQQTYSDEERPNNQNQQRPHSQQQQQQQQRPGPAPIRPGLRPPRPAQKKTPGKPPKNRPYQPRPQPQSQQQQQRPAVAAAPPVSQPKPKTPPPAPQTTARPATTKSPFPKKKISYLNSKYQSTGGTGEDDEDSEDINKVAPVELIGNSDAGEPEVKTTTTVAPETASSDEYDDDDDDYDDDYYDDDEDDDDAATAQDDEDDDYSDEEEDDKEAAEKKKKKKEELKEKRRKNQEKKKKEAAAAKAKETTAEVKPNKKVSFDESSPYFDDETDGVDKIWAKLNFATTGANHKPPEKLKKKEETKAGTKKKSAADKAETVADDAEEESDEEDEEEEDEEDVGRGSSVAPSQKTRTSSTSASGSDEDDDEVDDEHGWIRSKSRSKSKAKPKKEETDKKSDVNDDETKTKSKSKDSKKKKKSSSKNKEENSDEKDERAKWKQVMLEIGGRPLVPKPESDTANAKKTSGLVSNRFKLQFINPYGGGAPPQPLETLDGNHHGPYQPLRSSQIPTSPPSSGMAGLASSLPFKLNLNMNAGPLGAFAGGSSNGGGNGNGGSNGGGGPPLPESHGGHGPGPGGPGMRDSMDFSRPPNHHHHQQHHHGPPPSHHQHPHSPNQPPPYMQHHQESSFGGSGGGGSSLFKLNPLPALSKLFKRPSSSSSSSSSQSNFDSMQMPGGGGGGPQGHNASPMSAFVHRPIGPESSSYRREKISPASGSSNKKDSSTKSKSKGKGTKKKTKF